MDKYKKIALEELELNPWSSLDQDWAVVAAGGKKRRNAMTVSWGGFGVLWGKRVVTLYLRPQRYTRGFVEKKERFSLNFLPEGEESRQAMRYIGSVSGRDEDKMAKAGLNFEIEGKIPHIEGARLFFNCRVLYRGRIEKQNFLEHELCKENYPDKDYHFVYIAEVIDAYVPNDEAADTAPSED